ncbi:tetraacyldisaccharide 4'-kinase [Sinomicrobium soli]|uniref:tetraacyldisaccharide 4'-kinase n=1 Tax=Sinomicrobium sp. N-1-3-6 TaxID=2219864 RepID=UPI000DCD1DD1|nr:tetraacyldisaccharide 4'-kinase [Sinomicrobium sp. N-1-3-6]RAV30533.1 tetraacyldisaccharide 4'-kinase [Sinomicrobium sp. N-1-3-6]
MRILRKILWPFSLLYGGIVYLRNFLYDRQVLPSVSFEIPVICVGNLSVGGTGKTPMVEYLLRLLLPEYRVATLSRGYKRKSRGFVLAEADTRVGDLGDEPFQYHRKFPGAIVAVDADRVNGVRKLMQSGVSPEVVILDDAFQHRRVRAGFNILLTTFDEPFTDDLFLPAGNLRDSVKEVRRADLIVVTKCRPSLSREESLAVADSLLRGRAKRQRVFFTTIGYDSMICSGNSRVPLEQWRGQRFTLVTGIANPAPLVRYLSEKGYDFEHLDYPDHHDFSESELRNLARKQPILTTEKDFTRLEGHLDNLFYLGIRTEFLFGGQREFERIIADYTSGR